eukprot:scaffold16053_cov21-Tisochrysis_lutea.AAC.3
MEHDAGHIVGVASQGVHLPSLALCSAKKKNKAEKTVLVSRRAGTEKGCPRVGRAVACVACALLVLGSKCQLVSSLCSIITCPLAWKASSCHRVSLLVLVSHCQLVLVYQLVPSCQLACACVTVCAYVVVSARLCSCQCDSFGLAVIASDLNASLGCWRDFLDGPEWYLGVRLLKHCDTTTCFV